MLIHYMLFSTLFFLLSDLDVLDVQYELNYPHETAPADYVGI